MERRTSIQSFDWRTLIEARRLAPEIDTVCLTIETSEHEQRRPASHRLGWRASKAARSRNSPKRTGCAVWSPFWRNVTSQNVAEAHALGLKVVPWTINDPAEMVRQIDLKVDGLITDYPDRGLAVVNEKGPKSR
jgi:glycerophosphoryl diester phosphodiesterase